MNDSPGRPRTWTPITDTPRRRPFRRMLWGFPIVILDVRLDGFDLLPDLLGFILIALAASDLRARAERYASAWLAAIVLSVFALEDVVSSLLLDQGREVEVAVRFAQDTASARWAAELAGFAVFILLVHSILTAIGHQAATAGDERLRRRSTVLAFHMLIWAGVAPAIEVAAAESGSDDAIIVTVVGLLLAGCWLAARLLHILYSADQRLTAEGGGRDEPTNAVPLHHLAVLIVGVVGVLL